MFRFALLIVGLLVALNNHGVQSMLNFEKINQAQVCFEGKDNKFGELTITKASGIVTALKLVRLSGEIRCEDDVRHNSYWGCHQLSSLEQTPLSVIVTDEKNNIIFPNSERLQNTNLNAWYTLPFTDVKTSPELVFTEFAHPFYLPTGKTMRIWYGEDLKDVSEADNHGRVCVDVYAQYL